MPVNIYKQNGQYFTEDNKQVTPLNTVISEDPLYWTYKDELGNTYEPLSLPTVEKLKDYDTTLSGYRQFLMDKLTGNTTYTPQLAEVKTWDANNVDWSKTRSSQNPFVRAMTGTWLPIAGAALGAGALPWMWANKAAAAGGMVGGMVGGYGADAISKTLTGKDWGNLVASNTPLTPEMAQWVNPGTWVGGAVGGVTPQMRGLLDRYSLLNFKYNTHPSVLALEDEGWKYSTYDGGFKGLHSPKTSILHLYSNPDKTEMLDVTGGIVYVPNPVAHKNPQLHFNPNVTYMDNKSGYWNVVDSSPEKPRSIKEAVKLLNVIGDRVPLSQNSDATTKAQAIQYTINNGTWKDKLKYLLTGKYNWHNRPYSVDGYSTDIYPTMKNYANKGIGTLEKSVTTRLHGTNTFGESFKNNNLQRYFGEPENGEVYFEDMTPRQVEAWNAEQADTYGMHIDPKTRTSEQYIFVTGKDKPTYEEPSDNQNLTKGTLLGGTLFGKYALDLQNATTNLQLQLVEKRNSSNNLNNKKQQLWDVY